MTYFSTNRTHGGFQWTRRKQRLYIFPWVLWHRAVDWNDGSRMPISLSNRKWGSRRCCSKWNSPVSLICGLLTGWRPVETWLEDSRSVSPRLLGSAFTGPFKLFMASNLICWPISKTWRSSIPSRFSVMRIKARQMNPNPKTKLMIMRGMSAFLAEIKGASTSFTVPLVQRNRVIETMKERNDRPEQPHGGHGKQHPNIPENGCSRLLGGLGKYGDMAGTLHTPKPNDIKSTVQ